MKSINVDVEFEDLDAGGVVYHPNYIKLCDRARNRWFSEYSITFVGLKKIDTALAIRSIKADYLKPLFQETVHVKMLITGHTEKTMTILHQIFPLSSNNQAPHFSAEITLVAANYSTGRSCILPSEVQKFLKNSLQDNNS